VCVVDEFSMCAFKIIRECRVFKVCAKFSGVPIKNRYKIINNYLKLESAGGFELQE
jgi:hypothetical protein